MKRISLFVASTILLASSLGAAEVKIFRTDTRASFLAGELDGVAIDALGRLSLGEKLERLVAVDEPFVFSAAPHPEGWVLGTGNSGKVLLVSRDGEVRELFATPEPEVFALWVDPDGTVFAGSSPRGKVYRWQAGGKLETYFEPGETYIWSLLRQGSDLFVATGTQGKLFAVQAAGQGEAIYALGSGHLRRLHSIGDDLLLGTAGEGWVQRLSATAEGWQVRTLYDALEPEIVDLEVGPDGSIYVAALASESSLVDLSASNGKSDDDEAKKKEGGEGQVTVVSGGSAGSRRSGHRGPRSHLLRLHPGGTAETLWETDEETIFDLAWQGQRLWAATGLGGKVYSFDGEDRVLEATVDDQQIVALLPGTVLATSNAAALYRPGTAGTRQGIYESNPLDAGQLAHFGSLRWFAEVPAGASLRFAVRSGLSAVPDGTWSEWSEDLAGGRELALGEVLSAGRYVQWRVRLEGSATASPRLSAVELSYRQVNVAPRIASFDVLDPGEVLVPNNFNPANQTFEPTSPNRDGMFTTLGPPMPKEARFKTLWKKGYRSLRWKGEDGNGDRLRYSLAMRPESGDAWLSIADDLESTAYSFDAAALPDGVYRFRLAASDGQDNEPSAALTGERISGPVTFDHTVPELAESRWQGDRVTVEVADRWSPLRTLEVSVDGGPWTALKPADGLLDGRRERATATVPEGARWVVLRAMDGAFNVRTFDLSKP
ncbi:MAG: hypothetical protein AAF604_05130 [Acidobacteriota bacterium]